MNDAKMMAELAASAAEKGYDWKQRALKAEAEINLLRAQRDAYAVEIGRLRDAGLEAQANEARAVEAAERLRAENERLWAANGASDLQGEIESLKSSNAFLRERRSEDREKIESLQARCDHLMSEGLRVDSIVSLRNKEIERLNAKADTWITTAGQHAAACDAKDREIESLKARLKRAETDRY